MPDFIDQYIEIKENAIENTKKNPQAGQEPREFLDKKIEERKISRKDSFFKKKLEMVSVPYAEVEDALIKAVGEESAQKDIKNVRASQGLVSDLCKDLKNNHPEIYAEFTDEVLASNDRSKEMVNKLLESGKLPRQIYDEAYSRVLIRSVLNGKPEKGKKFLTEFRQKLTPETINTLTESVAGYVDIMERPAEEIYEKPFAARVQELKNSIPQDMDPVKKTAYIDALDFANSHLTAVDRSITAEMSSREQQGIQAVESRRIDYIVKENKDKFKGGLYNDMYEKLHVKGDTIDILKPGSDKKIDNLLNERVQLSDSTKQGIRDIFKKLDEMKIMDYGVSANGEDGDKIYGFNKLLKQKKELINALNNGDPDAIIKASGDYKKTWEQTQELYKIAKEHFTKDDTLIPGNMDSVRNEDIPFEFTGDLMTTAHINSVFLIYATLKHNNLDLETYLENPSGNLYNSIINKIDNASFEKRCQGLDFDDSLDFLTGMGKFHNIKEQFMVENVTYGDGRSMMGPTLMESDENTKTGNLVTNELLNDVKDKVISIQTTKLSYLKGDVKNEQDKALIENTLENLLVASDEDRNLNAMLGGFPETDMYGRVIGESFNVDKYIAQKPADYEKLIERSQKILNRCAPEKIDKSKFVGISGCKKSEFLEMAQKTFVKVLRAHEAERGTPGYDKLEQEALGMSKKLPEDTPPEIRGRMEKIEKHILARRSPDVIMDDLTAEGDRAQKNVYFGSKKYDDALNSLKSLKDDIKAFKAMSDNVGFDKKREALDNIRKKIEASQKAIDAYMDRKRDQGKLGDNADEKSKKRIAVMKKAEDALKRIDHFVDDMNIDLDRKEWALYNGSYELQQTKEMENLAAKSEGLDRIAAKAAADAYRLLQDVASKTSTMNDRDTKLVKEALAAIAFQKALTGEYGDQIREKVPANEKAFKKQAALIAGSEGFDREVGKLDRKAVGKFLKDPNEPARLEKQVSTAMKLNRNQKKEKTVENDKKNMEKKNNTIKKDTGKGLGNI